MWIWNYCCLLLEELRLWEGGGEGNCKSGTWGNTRRKGQRSIARLKNAPAVGQCLIYFRPTRDSGSAGGLNRAKKKAEGDNNNVSEENEIIWDNPIRNQHSIWRWRGSSRTVIIRWNMKPFHFLGQQQQQQVLVERKFLVRRRRRQQQRHLRCDVWPQKTAKNFCNQHLIHMMIMMVMIDCHTLYELLSSLLLCDKKSAAVRVCYEKNWRQRISLNCSGWDLEHGIKYFFSSFWFPSKDW